MKDSKYIGISVNKLRKNAGMTLKELSEKTGLSQGFLSKFERGQTTIAVDSLLQIAAALGTSIDQLLAQKGTDEPPNAAHIIHRSYENSVLYMENSFINYQITNGFLGMDVFPKLTVLLPTPTANQNPLFSHTGQEFVFVLEGVLTLQIESHTYELYPGDTAHFKSNIKHNWWNNTNRNTTILTIHTPNVFENGEPSDPAQKNKNGDFFVD